MEGNLSERAQALIDAHNATKPQLKFAAASAVNPLVAKVAEAARVYSHEAMVELMIAHPEYTQAQFSSHFGHPPGWFSQVLASESFQLVLDVRRHEVNNPSLTATMEERFRGLALRSIGVLHEKLNVSNVNDLTVLKAMEVSVKALGMGQRAPEAVKPEAPGNTSQSVEEKLLALRKARLGDVVDVTDVSEASEVIDG